MKSKSHGAPLSHCPICVAIIDKATPINAPDASPKPGDVSVCLACQTVLQFDEHLKLRAMNDRDVAALPQKDLLFLLDVIQIARDAHRYLTRRH